MKLSFAALVIFISCSYYAYPLSTSAPISRSGFWLNIAYSTASACICYFVFNSIPDFASWKRNKECYRTHSVYLFKCAAGFDKAFNLSSDLSYIGFDKGHRADFKKIVNNQYIAYCFSNGLKERCDRKHPDKVAIDFCISVLELINNIKIIKKIVPQTHKKHLLHIEEAIEDYLTSSNQFNEIQLLRSTIWRELDNLLKKHNHEFFIEAEDIIKFK